MNSKIDEKINSLLERLPTLGEYFHLSEKIGEGTFSSVYLAKVKGKTKTAERYFAVKHLIPTCHPSRVLRELKCMNQIGGVENVVGIKLCLRNNDCIVFIMPYLHHDKFNTYVGDMTVDETRLYIQQLLIALRRVHRFGIIHRDVKPSNFLYNRIEKKFLLVDFGLAQKVGDWNSENVDGVSRKRKRTDDESDTSERVKRQALQSLNSNVPLPPSTSYALKRSTPFSLNKSTTLTLRTEEFAKPGDPLPMFTPCPCDGRPQVCHSCLVRKGMQSPRAGTPGFRPPEVLLKYPNQTTAVDMWAVGVMMLCILSRTYPFFKSPDDVTALAELITVFGSEEIKAVATKLNRRVVCSEVRPALGLQTICERLSAPKSNVKYPPEAFDLLRRLLSLDPSQRITAAEALNHPFFINLPSYQNYVQT